MKLDNKKKKKKRREEKGGCSSRVKEVERIREKKKVETGRRKELMED